MSNNNKTNYKEGDSLQQAWGQVSDRGVVFSRIESIGTKYSHKLSNIQFGQNPNNKTFTKLHLAQTKEHFDKRRSETGDFFLPEGCYIEKVTGATPETMAQIFLYNLDKVGGPYGWANREKYQPQHMDDIVTQMADKETSIYTFHDKGKQVGFCTLSGIKRDWQSKAYEKGLNKMQAVGIFEDQEQTESWPQPVEIYKYGIFPDEVGSGYGKNFLNALTQQVFDEQRYNIIYLDTRDTNPSGAEEFYAGRGYRVFFAEKLKNDLVRPVPWPPSLTERAKNVSEFNNLDDRQP